MQRSKAGYIALFIFLIFSLQLVFACSGRSGGSGSGGDSGAPANFTRIVQLPYATDAVESEDGEATVTLAEAQSSGIRVNASLNEVFDEDSSVSACVYFSSVRRYFSYVGRGDAYFCLLRTILSTSKRLPVSIHDGEIHGIGFDTTGTAFCPEGTGCPIMRINFIVDNTHSILSTNATLYGKIHSFKMDVCQEEERQHSVLQQFNGNRVTVTSQGREDVDGAEQEYEVTFTSTLDEDAHYTSAKQITLDYSVAYPEGGDDYGRERESGTVTLQHYSDAITVSHASEGNYVTGDSWTLDFTGQAGLYKAGSGLDLERVFVGSGEGDGTLLDERYYGSANEIPLDQTWNGDLFQFLVAPDSSGATLRWIFDFGDTGDYAQGSGADLSGLNLCSTRPEIIFYAGDFEDEDLESCQALLSEDAFPNCWYLVE